MKENTDQMTLNDGTHNVAENTIHAVNSGFDLDSLRLSQNFSESVGVQKVLLTVPVRSPGRQDFIRIRPEPEYCLETVILKLKEDGTSYLIDRSLWSDIPGELVPKVLFTCINRQGVLFLWPVRLPSEDGRHDHWSRSSLEAAEMAKTRWVRVAANMNLGAYDVFTASSDLQEPVWPDVSFKEILRIAFRDQFIKTLEHPAIRRLRGEV